MLRHGPGRVEIARMGADDPDLMTFLRRAGLAEADETPSPVPLTGGVSSDILRIDLKRGPVCIKRALAQLKVEQDWQAPVARNAFEVAWMEAANAIVPGAAPVVLAHDEASRLFVMPFLAPDRYPLWKDELRQGRVDLAAAAEVGRRLAAIHGASRNDAEVARRFGSDDIFHAIRLEPYLEATARAHPELAPRLMDLVRATATTREALVHGDVSPKNILLGPDGPVFLDAECAWYGDPAFDVAFCLNHLLLKCLWTPPARHEFLAAFDALVAAYRDTIGEAGAAIEHRAAHLLPGLLLARVDGKSPVEYVSDEADKSLVRRVASALLKVPPPHLSDVRQAWNRALDGK